MCRCLSVCTRLVRREGGREGEGGKEREGEGMTLEVAEREAHTSPDLSLKFLSKSFVASSSLMGPCTGVAVYPSGGGGARDTEEAAPGQQGGREG